MPAPGPSDRELYHPRSRRGQQAALQRMARRSPHLRARLQRGARAGGRRESRGESPSTSFGRVGPASARALEGSWSATWVSAGPGRGGAPARQPRAHWSSNTPTIRRLGETVTATLDVAPVRSRSGRSRHRARHVLPRHFPAARWASDRDGWRRLDEDEHLHAATNSWEIRAEHEHRSRIPVHRHDVRRAGVHARRLMERWPWVARTARSSRWPGLGLKSGIPVSPI